MKNVAISSMTFALTEFFTGSVNLTGFTTAANVKATDNVCINSITVEVSGVKGPGIVNGTGIATINSSAVYNIYDGGKPMLEGDNSSIDVTGTTPPPTSSPVTLKLNVRIANAGQQFVKAE